MSHLVIARKYRPGTFASVRGQEHVTRTLAHSILRNRIAHAYLFSGPRGVGKTSMARIFAKALNCAENKIVEGKGADKAGKISIEEIEPCGTCENCTEIAAGTSFAVREIDGASHNSVDNVRDLIDSFRALPPPGTRYKIYIIDEVHMLSIAAFNALLKSLEEPPPNTIFILATTEAHRIPDTVLSRCQRFDFRAISFETIVAQLEDIAKKEKLKVEADVYRIVARLADGSMRDAQSLFERLQVFCEGTITAEGAGDAFGVIDRRTLGEISSAILKKDAADALAKLEKSIGKGIDVSLLIRDFAAYWRELLLVGYGNKEVTDRLGFSAEELSYVQALAQETTKEDLVYAVELIRSGCDAALRTSFSRAALEALLVRASLREPVTSLEKVLGELSRSGSTSSGISRAAGGASPVEAPRSISEQSVSVGTIAESQGDVRSRNTARNNASPQPVRSNLPSITASSPTETTEMPSGASAEKLDWTAFVQAVGGKSKVIHEHLKRLSPTTFVLGKLQASGASFTVQALELESNRKRLTEILNEVYGAQRGTWVIKLSPMQAGSANVGGVPTESIEGQGRAIAEDKRTKTTEALAEHPSVKALQKFFPGSQIDRIRVPE